MKRNFFLAACLVVFSSVSTFLLTTNVFNVQSQQIVADNEYQVSGVLYMQTAAEYRALAYQAYNSAKMTLDADFDKKNFKKLPKDLQKMPRAVVVDVDETILDNSPQNADLIKSRKVYDSAHWLEWCKKQIAKPISGAVEFLQYANSKGVKVFYVTNRKEPERAATLDNLKSAGFPDVTQETVMTRTDPNTASKEERRNKIREKYRIVLLMGDNLNDMSFEFENKSIADRFTEVDKVKNLWGTKFIALPNAFYGDWENAIYNYNRTLTETEKTAARNAALIGY
jgi:5'-nucleotidase (lipoprotein e(P4) family)